MTLLRRLALFLADLLDIATPMLLGILALPCNVAVEGLRAFAPDRTHAEVLALLDRAIAKAEVA